ncbi:MAG: riboflavin synthase [Candidatus Omnitrophica bacterium]|nr:riboflavin synthase [Candidatus Omnitrophota bacterium]
MFSGIVEETGIVQKIDQKPNLHTLFIKGRKVLEDANAGDSICVSGVCLTVTKRISDVLVFDIMLETIRKTTLGVLKPGSRVNLERALKMESRISGHFVSGHVDQMETIKDVVTGENYTELRITVSPSLKKYIVPKGSVCLDGVSLTVGDVRKNDFSVYLIPFTLDVTTLGLNKKGDSINIETDILAKYVLAAQAGKNVSPYSAVKKVTKSQGHKVTKGNKDKKKNKF